jgi:hypothetical protein
MSRTVYVEFALQIADDAELLPTLSELEITMSGENVLSWELVHVCDED